MTHDNSIIQESAETSQYSGSLSDALDDISLKLGLVSNLALILSEDDLPEVYGPQAMSNAIYSLRLEIERIHAQFNDAHTQYLRES